MYVRQLAWLRAAPGQSNASRLEAREAAGLSIDWPDIEGLETVAEYLAELGHAQPSQGGLYAVGFGDIESWARLTDTGLPSWLALLLRELSREYARQANVSSDVKCPPPYEMKVTEIDVAVMRKEADTKVRALFSNG